MRTTLSSPFKGSGAPYSVLGVKNPPPCLISSHDWIPTKSSALESYGSQHLRTPQNFEIGQGVAKLQHREVTVIFSNVPKMGPKTVLMRMSSTLLFKCFKKQKQIYGTRSDCPDPDVGW